MKKIVIGDTSVGTLNLGTEIIMRYSYGALKPVIDGNLVITIPTHTPAFHSYQMKSDLAKWVKSADYRFICGSNLLASRMSLRNPLWNINIFNSSPLKNCILVGVGRSKVNQKDNLYTRLLYNKVLSKDVYHSVRDEETKLLLERLGFKAINTGCISLWGFTEEFCKTINTKKSPYVVTSLNCKSQDTQKDKAVFELLKKKYEKIYFWPQTIGDIEYLKNLHIDNKIEILSNSVQEFGDFLDNNDVDYVGARLHGGIFCMHHRIRSVILSVDYRSLDMQKSNNLNVIDRSDINKIEQAIDSEWSTEVKLDLESIHKWIGQFV